MVHLRPEPEEAVMKTVMIVVLCLASPMALLAGGKENDRLRAARDVLKEILAMPDKGIPKDLLDKCECVVIFPSVKKAGFVLGASYGRGVIVCRKGENFRGPWSAPAMYALEEGSIGPQIGGQATDFVLLVMNQEGANSVLSSKVKLGAEASVAAGPVGRTAAAATDMAMKAEILSYSRSRGIFGGVSLEGATLRSDDGANRSLYGKQWTAKEIVREGRVDVPLAAQPLLELLHQTSPKHAS